MKKRKKKTDTRLLSTADAARALGISVCRVQQLILAHRLPAKKVGRDYVIREGDLAYVRRRHPGRPRTSATD